MTYKHFTALTIKNQLKAFLFPTPWDLHCEVLSFVSLIWWMIYFHSRSLRTSQCKSHYVRNKNMATRKWKSFVRSFHRIIFVKLPFLLTKGISRRCRIRKTQLLKYLEQNFNERTSAKKVWKLVGREIVLRGFHQESKSSETKFCHVKHEILRFFNVCGFCALYLRVDPSKMSIYHTFSLPLYN